MYKNLIIKHVSIAFFFVNNGYGYYILLHNEKILNNFLQFKVKTKKIIMN